MDHHEQHHQHHQKEREEKKKHHKEHERQEGKRTPLPIHPKWLLALAVALILAAVLIWTFLIP
jgi:cytoskeletal protein RodZ